MGGIHSLDMDFFLFFVIATGGNSVSSELWLGVVTYEEWNMIASFFALCCLDRGGWLWGVAVYCRDEEGKEEREKHKTHHHLSTNMASFSF